MSKRKAEGKKTKHREEGSKKSKTERQELLSEQGEAAAIASSSRAEALGKDPIKSGLYFNLGCSYLEKEDKASIAEARKSFKKAIASAPKETPNFQKAEYWHKLGDAYRAVGSRSYDPYLSSMQEKAKKAFETAVEAGEEEGYPEEAWRVGEYHSRLREAGLAYREATMFNPDIAKYWGSLGDVYCELGASGDWSWESSLQCAINAYKKAINLNKENAKYWYNLGQACFKYHMYIEDSRSKAAPEEAFRAYEKAVELDYNNEDYILEIGSVYFALGGEFEDVDFLIRGFNFFIKIANISPTKIRFPSFEYHENLSRLELDWIGEKDKEVVARYNKELTKCAEHITKCTEKFIKANKDRDATEAYFNLGEILEECPRYFRGTEENMYESILERAFKYYLKAGTKEAYLRITDGDYEKNGSSALNKAHYGLGEIAFLAGQYKEAFKHYMEASKITSKITSNSPDVLINTYIRASYVYEAFLVEDDLKAVDEDTDEYPFAQVLGEGKGKKAIEALREKLKPELHAKITQFIEECIPNMPSVLAELVWKYYMAAELPLKLSSLHIEESWVDLLALEQQIEEFA